MVTKCIVGANSDAHCHQHYLIVDRVHISSARQNIALPLVFVGLSFLSFRLCHLAAEVQNGVVELPSVWDYLSFAFFVPTLSVGPISPFHTFIGSLRHTDRTATPLDRSWLRVAVGLAKYAFLGTT